MVKKNPGKHVQKSLRQRIKQFELVGRAAPTEKVPYPKVYKLKVFAKNSVLAKSKYWYFMKRLNCAKRSGGQILRITEIHDKSPTKVSNYGVWLRYESRTDTHNMYKEFRDTSINGAIGQLHQEMSGRHRAQQSATQIMRFKTLKNSELRRPHCLQMTSKKVKFPMVRQTPLQNKAEKKLVRSGRYGTFVQ